MIETRLLCSFSSQNAEEAWQAIDDRVMGGVSQSAMHCSDQGTAVFSGTVSRENNGGFASVRSSAERQDLSGFSGILIRVKGDGKRYQLRLRTDLSFASVNYVQSFETSRFWQENYLPFEKFYASERGKSVENAVLDLAEIRTIGLLIGDKQEGPFRLELDWIKARK